MFIISKAQKETNSFSNNR